MAHRRRRSPRLQTRGGHRYQRTDRVAELVRQVVASELERIDDVDLAGAVITGVDVDRELSAATVHYDLREPSAAELAAERFEEHRPRLQRALGDTVRMRRTPALRFKLDTSLQQAERIEQLLAAQRQNDAQADA